MRVTVRTPEGGEIQVEGTPAEVGPAIRELQDLGVIPRTTQTTFAATQPQVAIVETKTAPASDGVVIPHNEALFAEYLNEPGISKQTRARRVRIARDFEAKISPKSLLAATRADVLAFRSDLLENCKSLTYTPLLGRGAVGAMRYQCRLGVYDWTHSKPKLCCNACPSFARQRAGPAAVLGHLKAFYDSLQDRGLVESNPVERVKAKHVKGLGPKNRAPKKYSPTLDEARQLVNALTIVRTPRCVALALCLMKWGRRPGHTLLVRANDLVNLAAAGPAWVSFEHVRDVVASRNDNDWTKLAGNLHSPIDNELRVYLRDVYLPWRQAEWGYEPNDENPLFPGSESGELLAGEQIQRDILDPAMEYLAAHASTADERARWAQHATPKSPTRISPGVWRHFYTTQQKLAGVENDDIDYTRGDIAGAARWHYMHLTHEDVERIYRMPALLSSE